MNKKKVKKVHLVMGISGCGKSTLGKRLAQKLGLPFLDADDFHPRENITKMSRGIALTDEDRWPWLAAIVEYILNHHREEFVLACSALKESYREYLSQRLKLHIIFLEIDQVEAERRLSQRKNHFMPKDLVASQLAALERPVNSLRLSTNQGLDSQIQFIVEQLCELDN